ncbi:MAG: hypothetical protein KGH75_09825 [Rhodospirillales bacterium]|nr:hypothetical protein [Rhodospirillales bacterium]
MPNEKSHIMRNGEYDSCANRCDMNALKKMHNHHREMAKVSEVRHLKERHENLADSFKNIIDHFNHRKMGGV